MNNQGIQDLELYLDLRQPAIDPEDFAAALAVQKISQYIQYGGSTSGRAYDEENILPSHLENFLVTALFCAQRTQRFVREWRRLQQFIPHLSIAWERGQQLFRDDLLRAINNQEEMEWLSQIAFAVDYFAYCAARRTYTQRAMLQKWVINGYMVAWRKHFLTEKEIAQ